ncbi:MAG: GAF domain-containing protein [Clostridiaceae bacterium]|nr:GAF domain-containing protein [Clostridiaceae bacterium]
MFNFEKADTADKPKLYQQINTYLQSMIQDESDWLAGVSNASALLFQMMPNINWAGFYLVKGRELVLGPFQGKPACIRIAFGKGVCGTAALSEEIQIVKDVNQFPGHIACDSSSRSEIVLPILYHNRLIGVLDIDSPEKARFDKEDADGLAQFIETLNQYLVWPEVF